MIANDHKSGAPELWRFLFKLYLWLSVAICLLLAGLFGLSGREDAKLIGAGLLLFAGAGIAFVLSWQRLGQPRWWHWALGAVLIAPGILSTLLSAG